MQYLPIDIVNYELVPYLPIDELFSLRATNQRWRDVYYNELLRRYQQEYISLISEIFQVDNITIIGHLAQIIFQVDPDTNIDELYKLYLAYAMDHNSEKIFNYLAQDMQFGDLLDVISGHGSGRWLLRSPMKEILIDEIQRETLSRPQLDIATNSIIAYSRQNSEDYLSFLEEAPMNDSGLMFFVGSIQIIPHLDTTNIDNLATRVRRITCRVADYAQ